MPAVDLKLAEDLGKHLVGPSFPPEKAAEFAAFLKQDCLFELTAKNARTLVPVTGFDGERQIVRFELTPAENKPRSYLREMHEPSLNGEHSPVLPPLSKIPSGQWTAEGNKRPFFPYSLVTSRIGEALPADTAIVALSFLPRLHSDAVQLSAIVFKAATDDSGKVLCSDEVRQVPKLQLSNCTTSATARDWFENGSAASRWTWQDSKTPVKAVVAEVVETFKIDFDGDSFRRRRGTPVNEQAYNDSIAPLPVPGVRQAPDREMHPMKH